jgi:hypothetical protein
MVVEFKTNTSDYAASGPLGIVGIATNYNVNETPFPDAVAFENSEYAVVTKPSMCIVHAIECAPNTGRDEFLYVRDPYQIDPTQTNDSRFYDMASVQVMTSGLPGTTGALLGQLWVSYDIEFSKPVVSPTGVAPFVISNPDGTIVPRSTSRSTSVTTEYSLAPAAATVYPVFAPSSGVYTTGDSALIGTVFTDLSATNMRIRRNGIYRFIVYLSGNTTTTNFAVGSANALSTDSTVAYSGLATVGSTKFDHGKVPFCSLSAAIAQTNGYQACVFTEFEVTGIATTSDYITFTPGLWTANNGSNISSLKVHVDMEWIATAR